jgi:D-alanyl-D-alanine carboxypeptidase
MAWRALVTLAVLLAATAGVISGASPATAGTPQQTRPTASPLQQLLDQIVVAGAPGAIGLVWDGTTTERAASGVADLRTGRPMRTADRFRVGSITKTFVATVVLQLVGEHVLRLSDPVERWLPGLVPNGAHITVENLLSHTSGLYNYTDDRRSSRRIWTAATGISSGGPGNSSASPRPIRRCSPPVPAGPTPTPATSCWA